MIPPGGLSLKVSENLQAAWFTISGHTIIAVADDQSLYYLQFEGGKDIDRHLKLIARDTKLPIIFAATPFLKRVEEELQLYFAGDLHTFTFPVAFSGTPFQKQVWSVLQTIPYGATWSYQEVTKAVGKAGAFRAVAQAIRNNRCSIIIPCHRVIYKSGTLGGYAGGVDNKQFLLDVERK